MMTDTDFNSELAERLQQSIARAISSTCHTEGSAVILIPAPETLSALMTAIAAVCSALPVFDDQREVRILVDTLADRIATARRKAAGAPAMPVH